MHKIISNNNIFFPEQEGFIKIENDEYNNLNSYKDNESLDLNSLNIDPMFVDVLNDKIHIKTTKPSEKKVNV